jgi:serine/threonine-protein kinase
MDRRAPPAGEGIVKPNRERHDRAMELFDRVVDLPEPERAEVLARECGDDVEMRRHVEELVAGDSSSLELELDQLDVAAQLDRDVTLEEGTTPFAAGARVGPYRVLGEIGRGGWGTVLLAARADGAYRQQVAIKVMHGGLLAGERLERFRAERKILGELVHPNIARLLDAGATAEGVPYFVMEHVEGEPLVAYCDRRRLGVDERLALFLQVCDAVRYAHQRLVVHRDLKPANILVAETGVPKLLDFGIAKVLDPTLVPVSSQLTGTAQRLLTPDYASPEQFRGEPITTASDVYSLGVVLYELLAGRRPYELADRSLVEMERTICEQVPLRPSQSAVGIVDDAVSPRQVATNRSATPETLRRRLSGDLDNIVLEALAKETEQRYASVEQLAADVAGHLRGLPVSARPSTLGYRTRKFVGRHRGGVALGATAILVLVGFAAGMGVLAARLAEERDRSAASEAESRVEARTAQRVADVLHDLFEEVDPTEPGKDDLTALELLNLGARRVRDELAGEPIVQARLLDIIGAIYLNRGMYDTARPLLEQALEIRSAPGSSAKELADSLDRLAGLLRNMGSYAEAEPLYRRSLAIRRSRPADEEVELATTLHDFGRLYSYMARFEEGRAMLEEALAIRREKLGEESVEVARTLEYLGSLLRSQGDFAAAVESLDRALALYRRVEGAGSNDLARTLNALGLARWRLGDLEAARRALAESLTLYRALMSSGQYTAIVEKNLGKLLVELGELDEAERLVRNAAETTWALYGEDSLQSSRALWALAGVELARGRRDDAEAHLRRTIVIHRAELPAGHPDLGGVLLELGKLHLDGGEPERAEPLLAEAYEILRNGLPEGHPRIEDARRALEDARSR